MNVAILLEKFPVRLVVSQVSGRDSVHATDVPGLECHEKWRIIRKSA
jgi:hypothetical protein